MPLIARKFPTYRAYAAARLPKNFGTDTLKRSLHLVASEFRSGVLLNRSTLGTPIFEWKPLPDIVQISPGYGVAAADFDGDGDVDAAIAQNLFTRESETGLWRGGLQLLRSTFDRAMEPVAAIESGIVIPGDARGATTSQKNRTLTDDCS
jgi:hypothetical protein